MIWIFAFVLQAKAVAPVCQSVQSTSLQSEVTLQDDANFLLSGSQSKLQVSLATDKGNRLVDLKEKTIQDLPSTIDPVLTPDSKMVSMPQNWQYDPRTKKFSKPDSTQYHYIIQGGMASYCKTSPVFDCKGEDITAEVARSKGMPYEETYMTFYSTGDYSQPLLIDKEIGTSQPSLGIVQNQNGTQTYRILYETSEGLVIRDYEFNSGSKRLSPKGSLRNVCNRLNLELAAISKTADEVAAYNKKTGETKIYSLGKSGQDCIPRESIPALVGRVDFSPDGSKLVFHVDSKTPTKYGSFIKPNLEQSLQAYVFDRKTKTAKPLTASANGDAYSPVFLDDNTVALIHATRKSEKNPKSSYSIKLLNLPPQLTFSKCTDCFKPETENGQLAAFVGALQLQGCQKDLTPFYKNALFSLSQVTLENCNKLVQRCDQNCLRNLKQKVHEANQPTNVLHENASKKWNISKINSLTREDLNRFCVQLKNQAADKVSTESTSSSSIESATSQ